MPRDRESAAAIARDLGARATVIQLQDDANEVAQLVAEPAPPSIPDPSVRERMLLALLAEANARARLLLVMLAE